MFAESLGFGRSIASISFSALQPITCGGQTRIVSIEIACESRFNGCRFRKLSTGRIELHRRIGRKRGGFVGTPEEVYRHPATPFVYSFLGSVNLFHGRVEEQALRVGQDALPHGSTTFSEGSEVVAFVRPHELQIVTDPAQTQGVAARVTRVLSFGVSARVELEGVDALAPQHYEVELTQAAAEGLALVPGQRVRLLPSRLQLFDRPGNGNGVSP